MSKQPLISVIVPVYNVEKYLRPCVGSILEQTYKNIEVILVNDGSTDRSKTICLELTEKDKRISYYEKALYPHGQRHRLRTNYLHKEFRI